ncbi:MAG: gamma-glutamyl-gamma-aminobutyrate hydrolase family protein [Alphaproteobacteria bacterium]|nr:gamma-glutamyl-gamma-aminobutyrate hydrolase family protein [Alphaproteobacteria bacterium]
MTRPCTSKPLIGIPAGVVEIRRGMALHGSGERTIDALVRVAGAHPVIIPALGDNLDAGDLLQGLDGLLLTGGISNIEPHHYDGPPARPGDLHDPRRDSTTLPLIRAAVDLGVPLLAICRGCQEFNVAFGGTLHQFLHEVPGRFDHRRDRTKGFEEVARPAHSITIRAGGPLAQLAGGTTAMVNSLHGQGIDRPGCGLEVEAVAEDTTIESISASGAKAFALGVQWHPELMADHDSLSVALFTALRDAAQERAAQRR